MALGWHDIWLPFIRYSLPGLFLWLADLAFHDWLGLGRFFIKLWGEIPNSLAMRMSSVLSRQTFLALAHCGSCLGLFVFAMISWIELAADDVNA
jgi:hypothetical protein